MHLPMEAANVESLVVYRHQPADPRYIAIYDYQWTECTGRPNGLRTAVYRDHGLHGDYLRMSTPLGTLALRRVGDGDDDFRAELRIEDRVYEMPIREGDKCACICDGCMNGNHCDSATCANG